MSLAIIRLLECHDPDIASSLSKALSSANHEEEA